MSIPIVIQRGGTSKGLYFHDKDLPPPGPLRDGVLLTIMGKGPIQIDGLGGSRNITSKIGIIKTSERADADVDYHFVQIEPLTDSVFDSGNCGNISAGVGPFAIDEGLIEVTHPITRVRIFNTNTQRILIAHVPVNAAGKAESKGDFAIPGVPGTGAKILLDYSKTLGAGTGHFLPTGSPTNTISLADGSKVDISIVDMANTCAMVTARDVGATGNESSDEVDAKRDVIARLLEIGRIASRLSGNKISLVFMLAPPSDPTTSDINARLLFMQTCHETVAGTAAICLTAAARTPGTIAHSCLIDQQDDRPTFRLNHPRGVMELDVQRSEGAQPGYFDVLAMSRTSRRIMSGVAYLPDRLATRL